MKAVMYHYVRPYDKKYPFFKNLHIDDFKLQLDYFDNGPGLDEGINKTIDFFLKNRFVP